jgi:trehalose synthase-fused probable maltokinase
MASGVEAPREIVGRWAEALPTYLPPRRWFADKNRAIEAVRLRDAAWLAPPAAGTGPGLLLAIAQVDLSGGVGAAYWTPAVWSQTEPAAPAARVLDGAQGWLGDAMAAPEFAAACLAALRSGRRVGGEHGVFVFHASPSLERNFPDMAALAAGRARLSQAEQSNSTVLYSDAGGTTRLLLKCFRRLAPGVNPDAEVTGYLTAHGGGNLVPPLAGTIEYHPGNAGGGKQTDGGIGTIWTVGIFQGYVANDGDGWEWVLRALRAAARDGGASPEARAALAPTLEAIAELGRCTAEMHLSLAAAPATMTAFAAEPLRQEDWAEWRQALERNAAAMATELAAQTAAPGAGEVARRLRGLKFPAVPGGLAKIRVHGDFHLGQTLRTRDGGWRLLDFEGEPARPLAERRQKLCVLKDVAGLLRSLDYAAGAASPAGPAAIPSWLEDWRLEARQRFQAAYFARLGDARQGALRLAPASEQDRMAALNFFELEKAVYEAGYELRNRPDWLALPLAGLQRLLR